jgi:hypothetical protein
MRHHDSSRVAHDGKCLVALVLVVILRPAHYEEDYVRPQPPRRDIQAWLRASSWLLVPPASELARDRCQH